MGSDNYINKSSMIETPSTSKEEDLLNHIVLMLTMALPMGLLVWVSISFFSLPWLGIYFIAIYIVMCVAAWRSWESGDFQ